MVLGIFLKSMNAIHNSEFVEYLFEFWPQFIMMNCWFGYMVILIISKWWTHYIDTSVAPSIVASMIDMFLKFGAVEKEPIIYNKATNERLNLILLVVSLLCIPVMLFSRPFHELFSGEDHSDVRSIKIRSANENKKEYSQKYFEFHDEEDIAQRGIQEESKKPVEEVKAIKGSDIGNRNETEEEFGENDELEDTITKKKRENWLGKEIKLQMKAV